MNKTYVHHTTSRTRRPDMTAQLHNAGVDTEGFLSLRLHQSLIPEGAELTIQIRDKQTGELFTMNLNDDDNRIFGKNSRFYGQMMADGNIFNPYIHRRFIAAQFHRLVVRHGIDGVADAVAREYDWKYAIEQLKKECQKLANLERHDRAAFAERSLFFSKDAIVNILSDYVQKVHKEIDEAVTKAKRGVSEVYVRHHGHVALDHIRPMKYRFTKLLTDAVSCCNFAELDKLLERFNFMELDRRIRLPESFVTPFINAGAFYTMKNEIMFENKRIYRNDCAGSLKVLVDTAKRSPNGAMDLYRYHG